MPVILDKILMVATPADVVLISNSMYKLFVMEIAGRELEVDLILLEMKDFDITLEMDWLEVYHAHIDCYAKKVCIPIP